MGPPSIDQFLMNGFFSAQGHVGVRYLRRMALAQGGGDHVQNAERSAGYRRDRLSRTMLIVLGGLPGVGKTTLAHELARLLGGVHIRIDSIELAIRESGVTAVSVDEAGYRVGYAVAEDNLRLGRIVIADSVNPLPVTRDAWVEVANRARVTVAEVEVECSDDREHRRRVEQRLGEISLIAEVGHV